MANLDDPKPHPAQSTSYGPEDDGHRQHKRTAVLWQATLDCGDAPVECQVFNLSPGGAKLRLSEPITRRSMVQLEGQRFGSFSARIVWHQDDWIGVSFMDEPTQVADSLSTVLPSLAA